MTSVGPSSVATGALWHEKCSPAPWVYIMLLHLIQEMGNGVDGRGVSISRLHALQALRNFFICDSFIMTG